ncbi:MAG: PAS-domain containing protein, partial [Hyphomicrobiaceae bacterium]
MIEGYAIFALALAYVGLLFAIAWVGDRKSNARIATDGRPLVYALSIAVYCTTWTFLGSVGTAATSGWGFVPVYLGPILMFLFGWPLILRIARIAKTQNLTSIADFLAARYGKSPEVAALVTIVAVVGAVPYIALQLKAIMITVETLQAGTTFETIELLNGIGDRAFTTGFVIAIGLALFAILFGTRHIDATEHQFGLILAISAESLVKLVAFISVGLYVLFYAFGGLGGFVEALSNHPQVREVFAQAPNGTYWVTVTLLSFCCVLLLPRQFHVTIVESNSDAEIRRASWLFPAYLVAINLLVAPIAAAGLILMPGNANPDLYVVLLPMAGNADAITMLAFIGGLSAAAAMVVVEAIALSIMICNGLLVPMLLRFRLLGGGDGNAITGSMLLMIRRVAIAVVVLLSFLIERALGSVVGLSAIGLIAFAAIAQLAPAFFLGLFWRSGTAKAALASISIGIAVWAYTLMLPWIVKAGWLPTSLLTDGPFGLAVLRPEALFFLSFDPLTSGVFWSLLANIATFVIVSQRTQQTPVERLQCQVFTDAQAALTPAEKNFKIWRSDVTVGDVRMTVARYLGTERAERSFREFAASRNAMPVDHAPADVATLRFTENLLASAIGAASSRLVLSLLLRRTSLGSQATLKLLDDASEALQHNRDLLQSAIDQVRHGLAVFDRDMRLICWNRRFREILDLPQEFGRVGVPLDRIVRRLAERGDFGDSAVEDLTSDRLMRIAVARDTFQERLA